MIKSATEVIDLLESSENEGSEKREREDPTSSDIETTLPEPKRRGPSGNDIVVIINSDSEPDHDFPAAPEPELLIPQSDGPEGRTVTLNYKSVVPGSKRSGKFDIKMNDTLQAFAEAFSTNKDDIEIRASGIKTSWYGTPEILFLDDPEANEVDVMVVSKDAGSEDEEEDSEPGAPSNNLLIRINTPNGRLEIRVRRDHTIGKIIDWVAEKQGIPAPGIRAEFDSEPIQRTDTVEALDLEDEDLIDMNW